MSGEEKGKEGKKEVSDEFPASQKLHKEKRQKSLSEKMAKFVDNENFKRFFRFGALDQNVLLLGLLTGVGVDSMIQRRFGVAGYGPIIGAGVSNWAADALATIPEGRHAVTGITVGTLLPLVPFFIYMGMKRNFVATSPPKVLVASSVGFVLAIWAHEFKDPISRVIKGGPWTDPAEASLAAKSKRDE